MLFVDESENPREVGNFLEKHVRDDSRHNRDSK
jgi:hypothetical protein